MTTERIKNLSKTLDTLFSMSWSKKDIIEKLTSTGFATIEEIDEAEEYWFSWGSNPEEEKERTFATLAEA